MSQTSRFRDLHSRTHEIELLISGALVFGFLQVPGYIESSLSWWLVRLEGLTSQAATYVFLYSEMLAYSLLGTFILHLCLRGYWVALLGLESVWPGGWDAARLKFGPFSRPHVERQLVSLSASIDRADDRASVVFAAGTLLVMMFLYSLALMVLAVAVAAGLASVTGGRISGAQGLFATFGVMLTIIVGLPMLDRFWGARITPDGRVGRAVSRLLRWLFYVSPVRWTGPVQFVFQTHIGERRMGFAMAGAATLLVTVMVGGLLWRLGAFRVDGWTYFNDTPAAGMFDPRYYRNSGAERDGVLPSIDGDRISGSYLRLYLPYRPNRHNALLATRCAVPGTGTAATVSNQAAAACVGALYSVRLDDQPLTGLTFDFTRDMPSEYLGVVTYLDVRTLPSGRHELVIESPGRQGSTTTVRIPFYRE